MCDISSFVQTATVARMKRVTPATVRNWADAGKLPSVRTIEGTRLFRIQDVEALDDKPDDNMTTEPSDAYGSVV